MSTVPLTERVPTPIELAAPVHLLSGGNTSVDDDAPWLVAARRHLTVVLERAMCGDASVTGICFGSQLIASVLAGPDAVGAHPDGMQAGLFELVDHDTGDEHVVSSFHYHRIRRQAIEAVGAQVVLDSERTEVQAFRAGAGVVGVQFHPEMAPAQLSAALNANQPVLRRHGASPRRIEAVMRGAARRWSDDLWRRFVDAPARVLLGRDLGLAG